MANGLASLDRIIQAGELALRAAKAAKALRQAGNPQAARALETECNRICSSITKAAQNRRAAAARARAARR